MRTITLPRPSLAPIRARLDERRILVGAVSLLTGYLALVPLLVLVYTSFKPEGVLPFEASPLVLDNYVVLFTDPTLIRVLTNTVLYVVGALLVGLALGSVLAWLLERTDLPRRQTIYVLLFVPLAVSPLVTTIGYVLLFGPRSGLVNVYARQLVGSDAPSGPFNVYSLGAMIVLTGVIIAPSLVLMIGPILRAMDPALEAAAAMAGATPRETLRRITLPLSAAGFSSAAIYYVIVLIEVLEIPLVIGLTVDVPVLSTYVYLLMQSQFGVPRYGLAATVGVFGVVIGIALMVLYFRLTRTAAERFAVITGKGYRASRIALGSWKYLALALIGVFLLLVVVLPTLVLVWASIMPFWQTPSWQALWPRSTTTSCSCRTPGRNGRI